VTSGPAHPGSECSDCRELGRFSDAKRTITDDRGNRMHLCLNHALPIVHQHNLYDFVCNPKGAK
jgi:hypothetical protein